MSKKTRMATLEAETGEFVAQPVEYPTDIYAMRPCRRVYHLFASDDGEGADAMEGAEVIHVQVGVEGERLGWFLRFKEKGGIHVVRLADENASAAVALDGVNFFFAGYVARGNFGD